MGRRLGQCLERIRDSGNVCTCCVESCRVEWGLLDQPSLLVLVSPHVLGRLWDTKELFLRPASPWSDLVTELHHPILPSFSLEGCSELSPCLCLKLAPLAPVPAGPHPDPPHPAGTPPPRPFLTPPSLPASVPTLGL